MSKITKALEKAARDRSRRQQEHATIQAKTTEIRVAAPSGLTTRPVTQLRIDPHLVAASDPQSPISEQYRILRTNLQSMKRLSETRSVLVTSSVHGEGKSVTSINLALTMAQQEGMRVILIDGDLRRPTVHQWLGLSNEQGLSNALTQGARLEDLVVTLESPTLSILPAGPMPKHPAELLDSAAMKRLMERLRTEYDLLVVDSPPALPVADPGILARYVDGVLFVVRSGKTQQRTVLQAFSLLKQAKVKMLRSVLTHVEHYIPGYYRYYHYYRYVHKNSNGSPATGGAAPISPDGDGAAQAAEPTE